MIAVIRNAPAAAAHRHSTPSPAMPATASLLLPILAQRSRLELRPNFVPRSASFVPFALLGYISRALTRLPPWHRHSRF